MHLSALVGARHPATPLAHRCRKTPAKEGGATILTCPWKRSGIPLKSSRLGPSEQFDFDGTLSNQLKDWQSASSAAAKATKDADTGLGLYPLIKEKRAASLSTKISTLAPGLSKQRRHFRRAATTARS